jgi:hypothetical protein
MGTRGNPGCQDQSTDSRINEIFLGKRCVTADKHCDWHNSSGPLLDILYSLFTGLIEINSVLFPHL